MGFGGCPFPPPKDFFRFSCFSFATDFLSIPLAILLMTLDIEFSGMTSDSSRAVAKSSVALVALSFITNSARADEESFAFSFCSACLKIFVLIPIIKIRSVLLRDSTRDLMSSFQPCPCATASGCICLYSVTALLLSSKNNDSVTSSSSVASMCSATSCFRVSMFLSSPSILLFFTRYMMMDAWEKYRQCLRNALFS